MRALITGVGGFVGRHLLRHLQAEGDDVYGLGRAGDVGGLDERRVVQIDLFDRAAVERAVGEVHLLKIAADARANRHLIDSLETAVLEGKLVRVVSWYDNEWGFSNRMVDTAAAMAKLG